MARFGIRSFYLYLDPGLRLIHTERTCPEAKVAAKYDDLESVCVGDSGDGLPAEVLLRGRPCPSCTTREQKRPLAQARPPGFREALS